MSKRGVITTFLTTMFLEAAEKDGYKIANNAKFLGGWIRDTASEIDRRDTENAALRYEIAELREAAAWFLEVNEFAIVGVNLGNTFAMDQELELDDTYEGAERALRALVEKR